MNPNQAKQICELSLDTSAKLENYLNSIGDKQSNDIYIINITFDEHMPINKLICFLKRCSKLYRISLKGIFSNMLGAVPALLRACCPSLRQIELNFRNSAYRFIETMLPPTDPITCLTNIEVLEWVTYYPIVENHSPMLRLLNNMPKMRDLNMVFMDTSNKSVLTDEVLGQITRDYPLLRNISFQHSNLTDDKIIEFIKSRNKPTTVLDFKGSKVSDDLLVTLAELCPELEDLRLIKAKGFSVYGVRTILEKCKKLNKLILEEIFEGDCWKEYERRMDCANPWRVEGRNNIEIAYNCMNYYYM